jgi:hypothetical protein
MAIHTLITRGGPPSPTLPPYRSAGLTAKYLHRSCRKAGLRIPYLVALSACMFVAPGDQERVQVRPRSNTLTESRNVVQVLDLPVTLEKDDQPWKSPPQIPRAGGRNAAVRDT